MQTADRSKRETRWPQRAGRSAAVGLIALVGLLGALTMVGLSSRAAEKGKDRAERRKKRGDGESRKDGPKRRGKPSAREKRRDPDKRKRGERDRGGKKKAGGKGPQGGRRAAPRKAAFSDEAVRRAIERGKKYLWAQRKPNGSWAGLRGGKYPVGPSCLAAYALLASGVSPVDARMDKALEWLSLQPCTKTYSLGLRCNVWLLANRETNGKYTPQFRRDVVKLIKSTKDGSYGYDSFGAGRSKGDNSNSQYGVLGVWAGALGLAEVPRQYWLAVARHWQACQHRDGGWCYRHGSRAREGNPAACNPRATMVAAGLATLFVCFDNLFSERFVKCNVNPEFRPIRRGLDWMDRNFVSALGGGRGAHKWEKHFCYFLYGVERVGLASGYKYFGTADWYKLGAQRLLALQSPNGSFGRGNDLGGVVPTGFALLFLVRGQHPVAFNKLEFDGDWNNRPRDMAGLTRWLSNAFERGMNWQIINLKVPVEEWHDAPILYISGSQQPKFTPQQLAKLRRYVWQGGTIFSVTECGGEGFSKGIRSIYRRMLPGRELEKLPADHVLYTIHDKLNGRPAFHEINNGVRPLVIHTDTDLPRSWQLQLRRSASADFRAASNVLMYVTDKGKLRNRGVGHWPRKKQGGAAGRTVKIARLRYDGNWDPEPLAYERFGRLMAAEAKVNIEVMGEVPIGQLDRSTARIATLTGTDHFTLPDRAKSALKSYVTGGGLLIVDAAGGSRAFGESASSMLREMFGRSAVRRLSSGAPLYGLPGREIQRVSYRRRARLERGLKTQPNLRGVMVDGRLAVIFSTEDLTGGLVGCPSYHCVGYEPESCFELMRNAVLLAAGRKAK